MFTSILNKRVNDWVENNNIVSDAQFGLRKARSTVDAILVLNTVIQKILNEKKRLYCAVIDLKKAFDSINLHNIWYKLFKQGLNGKMLQLIKDMYNNVKSCVRGCNSLPEYFNCVVGLKRGEVMSLILFSLLIEDLELCLQDDVNCGLSFNDIMFVLMLFADDMVILDNSPADLQQRLELISEYCSKWGLQVNTVKSKNLVFRKRDGLRPDEVLQYNGHGL